MKRNCSYQRYHGFCSTLHELQYSMGLTHNGLQCTQVWVQCWKTRPVVYHIPSHVIVPYCIFHWLTQYAALFLQCM